MARSSGLQCVGRGRSGRGSPGRGKHVSVALTAPSKWQTFFTNCPVALVTVIISVNHGWVALVSQVGSMIGHGVTNSSAFVCLNFGLEDETDLSYLGSLGVSIYI